MSEVVRVGRIPVYLYSDYPWLPYEGTATECASTSLLVSTDTHSTGTKMSPTELGLLAKTGEMAQLVSTMSFMLQNNTLIGMYMQRNKQAHVAYTNEGVLQQLKLFFAAPLTGGYLRCSEVYKKHLRDRAADPFKHAYDVIQSIKVQ